MTYKLTKEKIEKYLTDIFKDRKEESERKLMFQTGPEGEKMLNKAIHLEIVSSMFNRVATQEEKDRIKDIMAGDEDLAIELMEQINKQRENEYFKQIVGGEPSFKKRNKI